jgi:hypothetical protein
MRCVSMSLSVSLCLCVSVSMSLMCLSMSLRLCGGGATQVLKLYYSLALQEFRSQDPAPDSEAPGAEEAAELGSDVVREGGGCVYLCISAYICVYMCVCLRLCMCISVCVCVSVCMCMSLFVCGVHVSVSHSLSAQGYEFVRDAVRHCLFHNENITISGKLVDIFAVKVCVSLSLCVSLCLCVCLSVCVSVCVCV